MSTEPQRTCPSCGNEVSGAVEFCPVCLLRKALAGGVESGESSSEEAVTPTLDQAVQRFEHYELAGDGRRRETDRVPYSHRRDLRGDYASQKFDRSITRTSLKANLTMLGCLQISDSVRRREACKVSVLTTLACSSCH